MEHIHSGICSALKINKVKTFKRKFMDLENVKLCDLSHDHKYKYHRKLAFLLSLSPQ